VLLALRQSAELGARERRVGAVVCDQALDPAAVASMIRTAAAANIQRCSGEVGWKARVQRVVMMVATSLVREKFFVPANKNRSSDVDSSAAVAGMAGTRRWTYCVSQPKPPTPKAMAASGAAQTSPVAS
jgi:hypothetical protein